MTQHVSWETLNDAADGVLVPAEQADVALHVAKCAACRAQFEGLRALMATARAAPATSEPPAHAWTEIRRTIDAQKTLALPGTAAPDRRLRISRSGMAAAALVLITVSSAATIAVLRQRATVTPTATVAATDTQTAAPPQRVSHDVSVVEEEYLSTAAELRSILDKERSKLSPATVAAVDRSLKVIDDAIAEARAAMIADPANSAIRDLLQKNYEQKINFLRRTTTLLQQV